MVKAVFLDRDGVINDNTKHVNKPEDLVIYEEAKIGMKILYEAGYELFVVTNQGGVELGHLTHQDLEKIHDHMIEELKSHCRIKAVRYCPDFKKKSKCRKPQPGMIIELAEAYHIDLKNSWMVGDMDTDVLAGKKAGCKTAKIGRLDPNADINGRNLEEIAKEIIDRDT